MSGFQRSQGFLLAGAVAYYTLLAIVPLFVVLLVGVSHVVDEHRLLDTVPANLQLVIPSQAAVLTEQVETFLAHREVIGIVGLVALVFFSSTAFTVIESAMAIIFYHRTVAQHRHFLVSVLLPYLFMTLIGVGLLLITVISGALHAGRAVRVFGHTWPPAGLPGAVLYLLGVAAALILLFGGEVIAEIDRARVGRARAREDTAEPTRARALRR